MAQDERDLDASQLLGELSGDVGEVIEDILNDVNKITRVFKRAFPGEQPGVDEVRARRDKLRRAETRPGLERIHEAAEPSEDELEAAELQEAARGEHTIYAVTARHRRVKPFESDWVGHTQAVRVTLPRARDAGDPVWTHLGVVKREDHLLFSVEEIVSGYAEQFGARPSVQRVDLITGARHYDLDRFAPLSVFLAYEHAEDKSPSFYVYESGSAQGNPAQLYWAPTMGATIHQPGGFRFTPFSDEKNWYTGTLVMNRAKTEPSVMSLSISQTQDDKRRYFNLTASIEVVEPGPVYWPVADQLQAASRVFAIAQGMGCQLDLWEWALGQVARGSFDWITQPRLRGRNKGYSDCDS